MDHKFKGFLKHYVLAFMLLAVQWRLMDSAAIPTICHDLDKTIEHRDLLSHEAKGLLKTYKHIHFGDSWNHSVPGYVDNFTISGGSISEKLQSLCTNNALFELHFSKVKEYQKIWHNPKPVTESLSNVTSRLKHQSARIHRILKNIYPESPLPPTPAPLHLSHANDFAKKLYGWDVILTLIDYQTKLLQVIEELCVKKGCSCRHVNSVKTVTTANIS